MSLGLLRIVICGLALGGAWPAAATSQGEVLARWRGGELTGQLFQERYDRDGAVRRRGGDELLIRICKAAFTEAYHRRALALGLDRDPDYLTRVEAWQEERLAELYRQFLLAASADTPTDTEVKAEYENRPERYTTAGEADLEVLFVRCEEKREGCHDRMSALRRRVAEGEAFAAILAEERRRSGAANGRFERVGLNELAAELRSAVLETEPGGHSQVVDTPIGLFWVRVLRLEKPTLLPLAALEKQIRRRLSRERQAEKEQAELGRLRQVHDAADASEETLLAGAARSVGLDRTPEYQRQLDDFARSALADHAFYRDREILPSDEELRQRLSEPEAVARYHRLHLLLALAEPGDDRWAALELVRQVTGELAAAVDRPAFLLDLANRDPRFEVRRLEPMSLVELGRQDPQLRRVVTDLGPGEWRGPFAYRDDPPSGDSPTLLGLALLEGVESPPFDEVRDRLLRDFRASLGARQAVFDATFGRRWGLEVLLPQGPSAAAGELDGRPE